MTAHPTLRARVRLVVIVPPLVVPGTERSHHVRKTPLRGGVSSPDVLTKPGKGHVGGHPVSQGAVGGPTGRRLGQFSVPPLGRRT